MCGSTRTEDVNMDAFRCQIACCFVTLLILLATARGEGDGKDGPPFPRIANVYGIDLSVGDFLRVILMATLASIGTAGVPGVGLIMLSMVLTEIGLPVEGIGIILGVDRLLDMTRTAVNVTGDLMCTAVVARSEGEFDPDIFGAENVGGNPDGS